MAWQYWTTLQIVSLLGYFSLIIVTIPLAFDVGGEDCGIVSFFSVCSELATNCLGIHLYADRVLSGPLNAANCQ